MRESGRDRVPLPMASARISAGAEGSSRPPHADLAALSVIELHSDEALDQIVRLAARTTNCERALITLIQGDTLHVIAAHGSVLKRTETAMAVCGTAYRLSSPLIVADLSQDKRFKDLDYVRAEGGTRFYAGFPVRVADGGAIGTLCVCDPHPRPDGLTIEEMDTLSSLTSLCVRVLEGHQRDARLGSYLEIASDWIWEQDTRHRFTFLSRSAIDAGIKPERILGKTRWDAMTGNGESAAFWAAHKADLDAQRPFRDLRFRWFDHGVERVYAISGRPVFGTSGVFIGYRGSARDVTAEELARRQIEHLARHDPLTGLANRATFEDFVNAAFAKWQESGAMATIFLIDIDHFKLVNDTHGHSTGDALLIAVAERLGSCVGPDATITRLGGDEFAILEPRLARDGAVAEYAAAISQAIANPFDTGHGVVECGCSIGIAMLPDHGATFSQIMGNADLALYESKSKGRRRFTVFEMELRREADHRNTLTREIGEAVDHHQFKLVFQPVVRISDETIVGAEALLRWDHPVRGQLPPGAFLSTLDSSRHAADVGYWVLEEACRAAGAWQAACGDPFRLSVNLFSGQLRDPRLVNRVRTILERTGFDGRNLELEITEDILLTPTKDLIGLLRELKQLGLAIVLDDFGTGFGSLTHLLQFSIDRIKIDREFVRGLGDMVDYDTVTRALVKLASELGLRVTAEGIETDEQKRFLAEVGCDDLQGFHFSRPVHADQMPELIEASRRRLCDRLDCDALRHAGAA